MKKLALAAAMAALGSTAFAGGLDEPVMEMTPVEIVDDTAGGGSSGDLIVPLILIALIAAAVGGSD